MANEENITDELILLPGDPSAIADPMVPIEEQVKGLGFDELQGKEAWYERLPYYDEVTSFTGEPEKPSLENLWADVKGTAKQGASFFQDMAGFGYNALDLGGIIPGETGIEKFFLGKEGAKDDPNFGLVDFVKNMAMQKREGEFAVPFSEVKANPEFMKYTNNLNEMVIGKKTQEMYNRLEGLVAEAGFTFDMIPEDIRRNIFSDETDDSGVPIGASDFFNYIGGPKLDEAFHDEFSDVVNLGIIRQNYEDRFYADHSIWKMDWSDEDNPIVVFGNMPKVDHGPFGLDLNLDPGYSGDTLNLTNLGKYAMRDGKLTRVQPSVQNWASDWNVNPDRFGGILQSAPGYEALGKLIDDKWVKNVAWQGHDFDFPEGVESDAEKTAFLYTMYPLMAQGIGVPAVKALSSSAGKVATGTGGTTLAAAPETDLYGDSEDDLDITLDLPYTDLDIKE